MLSCPLEACFPQLTFQLARLLTLHHLSLTRVDLAQYEFQSYRKPQEFTSYIETLANVFAWTVVKRRHALLCILVPIVVNGGVNFACRLCVCMCVCVCVWVCVHARVGVRYSSG